MKTLVLIPPQIPSYFNAGHHLTVFEVASYLRQRSEQSVTAIDAAALNCGWRDLCHLLRTDFDLVALLNDFDAVDTFERTLSYVGSLCPRARTITFGRLSKSVPRFFERFRLDAIVASGDPEAGMQHFLDHLQTGESTPGVVRRDGDAWVDGGEGTFLPSAQWALPDVSEIPYESYGRMYANDLNKYCGIPERMELVVPVARGCPIGCSFCDVPTLQGLKERRISVERTVQYIHDAFDRRPFEYVSFYAPTFTLKRRWVLELCEQLCSANRPISWKCTSTMVHLDEDLLATMADAGCVRVSVGLETLTPEANDQLPQCKRDAEQQLRRVAAVCRQVGIELNCFVIAGLPGDRPEGVRHTIEVAMAEGARLRPTVYAPYHEMHEDMSVAQMSRFNRQLFVDERARREEVQSYYNLLYANGYDRPTAVMERIPKHA